MTVGASTLFGAVSGSAGFHDLVHFVANTLDTKNIHTSARDTLDALERLLHNAATGYWSIITKSHEPANAICAHDHSPFMALLEAAIQCADENQPMLVVSQEVEAPLPFSSICANRNPCAAALLISPEGPGEDALARLQLEVIDEPASWPDLPKPLQSRLTPSSGANLLALLAAIGSTDTKPMQFPLTPHSSLRVWITEHV